MLIEYIEHALLRIKQRRIPKRVIEETIQIPDSKVNTYQNRIAAIKKYGDKFLKVIYEKDKNKTLVITAYWTRRLH